MTKSDADDDEAARNICINSNYKMKNYLCTSFSLKEKLKKNIYKITEEDKKGIFSCIWKD